MMNSQTGDNTMVRRPKICFLGNPQSVHLHRWMDFFSNAGWEVKCLVIGVTAGVASDERVIILPSVCGIFEKIRTWRTFLKTLKTIAPDIINIHYVSWYHLLVLLTKKKPIIISCWGSEVLIEPYQSWRQRLLVKAVCWKADMIISIASHMTDVLTGYLQVPAEKVMTQPWGCDTEYYFRDPAIVKEKKKIRIIYTRSFKAVYNWETLLRAIPLVTRVCPDYEFIMVGGGLEREKAEMLVDELKVREQVTFTGWLTTKELAYELNRANIFVSISFSDGNNISLNEAMACGVFPICSDIPANTQWIENGVTGIILNDCCSEQELADAIIAYVPDSPLVVEAVEKNIKTVKEKADFKHNITKLVGIFAETVRNNENKNHREHR